jgi:transposase
MPRPAPALALNIGQRAELEALVRNGNTPQKVALRGRLLLLAHQGLSNQAIAEQLDLSRPTILALRHAFAKDGIAAVTGVRKRKRRAKVLTPELEQKILDATLKTRPGDGSTHWSVRMLARHLGISRTIVHRVWQRHDVQPHRVERFKLSNDPHFEEKVRDIVGLYLNPPDRALVLCVDEKSQIQALDRTQPGLPLKKGRAATMTHDYKRHGTTTLYAALDVKSGLVIGDCQPRHRAKEFIRFLKLIDRIVDRHFDLHLVVDNYGTHKTPAVKAWLAKHPRFHLHFTPTSASWLNLVERFFAEITRKRIRRGTFTSVAALQAAILDYLSAHNANPKPFVWTKTADVILEKERRALDALENVKGGYQALESEH